MSTKNKSQHENQITNYEEYEKQFFPERTKKKKLLINEPVNFGANLAKHSLELLRRELEKKITNN